MPRITVAAHKTRKITSYTSADGYNRRFTVNILAKAKVNRILPKHVPIWMSHQQVCGVHQHERHAFQADESIAHYKYQPRFRRLA
jgi:hypothetical protein